MDVEGKGKSGCLVVDVKGEGLVFGYNCGRGWLGAGRGTYMWTWIVRGRQGAYL